MNFNFFPGSSERTIINPATLEKLLYILNPRSSNRIVSDTFESVQVQSTPLPSPTERNSKKFKLKVLIKELSDKNNSLEVKLKMMKIVEKNYEELVKSSELCDDDNEFETNLKIYERKIDFLKYENDQIHVELKAMRLSSFALINDLKLEIVEKQVNRPNLIVKAKEIRKWTN